MFRNDKIETTSKEEDEAKHKEIQMEIKHKRTSSSFHYFVSENNSSVTKGIILFIHSAFADHRAFDEQVNFFSVDYKVTTLDLLGNGLPQGFKSCLRYSVSYKGQLEKHHCGSEISIKVIPKTHR